MEISLPNVLAISLPALGLAGTWSVLGYRIRQLEKQAAAFDEMRRHVDVVDAKIEFVRKDQGTRLGVTEGDIKDLKGELKGFKDGFATGRRSRTMHGVAVPEKIDR